MGSRAGLKWRPRIAALAGILLLPLACGDDTTSRDATGTDGPMSGTAGEPESTSSGAADTENDSADESSGSTGEPPELGEFVPGEQVLPRLTTLQYANSLDSLFGPGLPSVELEPDTNPYLFYNIGAASTTLSELGVQQYEEAADQITTFVFDDTARRDALVGCVPAAPGDACVEGFLADFGRRAFRRPLTPVELERWRTISVDQAEGDAWQGLRLAVAGLLQSPYFLYRVELGEPDPDDPTRMRYTGYEMASRVSFLLWNVTPDDELLDAAESGDLETKAGLRDQARRLLSDPRAASAVQAFFGQYFDLGRLEGVSRDEEDYPEFSPTLVQAMRAEVELLVDDLVNRQDGDIRSVFSTRNTFVNSELAELYGVTAAGSSPIAFAPVELPADGPRAGLLTLGAFLTMNAHETETSPTLRGKYVRERVLCQTVPAPPDDVNTDLNPEGIDGQTLREILDQHREDPACSGCHLFTDPPGYLFENFDSLGNYRTVDRNGFDIDATGELDAVPLQNARELADLLATDERVGECIVKQLFRHASGRLDNEEEEAALADLSARFAERGYRFRELVVELVAHESFRYVSEQTEEEVGE